ncbi:MAG TPA: hypothetical protein EYP82_02350 [Hydrogenothermaceae bacterium]|nr:hypothetical protein [Hydrogenothermaceae bacterium]HIQ50387.1 hypothetical protein [Nautiliaceae bacterium]
MKILDVYRTFIITSFAILNILVATIVSFLKLPLYLDSIGTVSAVILLGLKSAILVAIITNIVLSITSSPTYFSYTITAIVIAITAYILQKYGYLKNIKITIIGGIIIGLVSTIVSAPITTFLYGGISFSGTDTVILFFKQTGYNIFESVVLGGLSVEPVDKTATSIIAYILVKNIDKLLKWKFS